MLPPYEVPEADRDLLDAGVVLSPWRLAAVHRYNAAEMDAALASRRVRVPRGPCPVCGRMSDRGQLMKAAAVREQLVKEGRCVQCRVEVDAEAIARAPMAPRCSKCAEINKQKARKRRAK